MSVQFGRWSFDGEPASAGYLAKVGKILSPYGPDGESSHSGEGVDVLYYAFHTTTESRLETQPHVSASGAIITWDGRLDNRGELIALLDGSLSAASTDVSIVAAAYERWGTDCFAQLIGDWALSIWNPNDRALILVKDPIGTRHLYYAVEEERVTWGTVLDPLILFAGRSFQIEEEYIAGWFALFPAVHLTPYVGIDSVPPSSFVLIKDGMSAIHRYWHFNPDKKIRYRSDAQYEEHFRFVFAQSVRRRLRSDHPILAELSGGMDSSSIVCMADHIIAGGGGETPRLDTLSYYDDSEPNWNERPYFTKVEEKRGRVGCHIDVSLQEPLGFPLRTGGFAASPGSGGVANGARRQFAACVKSQGNRVLLSGTGGDEVTGGVPTATPELRDLLARVRLGTLAHQLKVWSLNKRKPWFHLFLEATRDFFPPALMGVSVHRRPPAWLDPRFAKRHWLALIGYESRVKLFGPLPSFQENLAAFDVVRRQLACDALPSEPSYEKRYPYLDRDLVEFLYAVPREQLVRPGQRRSLMRRALAGIVPDELLSRRRKAFVARGPRAAICNELSGLAEISEHMISTSLGIVDPKKFAESLSKARYSQEVPVVALIRTLFVESWLTNLSERGLLVETDKTLPDPCKRPTSTAFSAEKN